MRQSVRLCTILKMYYFLNSTLTAGYVFWHVFGEPIGITIFTMKYFIALSFVILFSITTFADTGTLENIEVNTDLVGVNFEDKNKTLVLTFSDNIQGSMHSIIDIQRINNLKYKTQVMRYFGGLLVNETHRFKNLVVVIDGKRMMYDWSRDNVSTVVKKMCQQAEMMI